MEFYRELGTAPLDQAEAILRRWWCEAMLDTDPDADQIRSAALEGTLPVVTFADVLARSERRACPLSEPQEEGWPCYFSEGVAELLADPRISPTLFSAVAALSFEINERQKSVAPTAQGPAR